MILKAPGAAAGAIGSTSSAAPETPFTLRTVAETLSLGRGAIVALIDAGFLAPTRGPRNEYLFSFQDMVLLRTAHQLRAARVSPQRMLRSLKQLRAQLPAALPLSGLRIQAIGNDVAVREGTAQWAAESGQGLLDFEVQGSGVSVLFLQRVPLPETRPAPPVVQTAEAWFQLGEALEANDPAGAEAAYRAALAEAPGRVDAYLNLGAMLCDKGRCGDALLLYEVALEHWPDEALLHFNAAIALEDQQRHREALSRYERCLVLEPDLADAHFNAARLHEKLGQTQAALRHYSAYRRLQR